MRLNDLDKTSIKYYLSEDLKKDSSLNEHWDRIDNEFFKPWQRYLNEATLTPDQINQMFAAAEKETSAGGGNSSLLGKIVDKVIPSAFLSKLEKSLPEPDPNAQPDPEFEAKATAAVQQLQAPAETKTGLMAIVKAAVKNPQVQAMVLSLVGGVLGGLVQAASPLIQGIFPGGGTAVVAITGAIVAGGVAIAAAKLQGKGWKEAFKGAIKPALAGAAGAVIGSMAAQFVGGAVNMAADAVKGAGGQKAGEFSADPALNKLNAQQQDTLSKLDPDKFKVQQGSNGLQIIDKATGELSGTIQAPPGVRPGDLYAALEKVNPGFAPGAPQAYSGQGVKGGSAFDNDPDVQAFRADVADTERSAAQIPTDTVKNPDGSITQRGAGTVRGGVPDGATATDNAGSYFLNKTNPDGSTSQTVRSNADPADPRVMASIKAKQYYYKNDPAGQAENKRIMAPSRFDSYIPTGKKLSEGQVYLVFNKIVTRNNDLLGEGRLAEGPMDWLKTKAKNLTTKVTADKLNTAWQKAGSPTDSEQLKKFLTDQGVATEVVDKVYTDMKLPAAGAEKPVDTAELEKQINTFDTKQKQDILAYLTQSLRTA